MHIQIFSQKSDRGPGEISSYHASICDGTLSRTDMLGIARTIREVVPENLSQYLQICHALNIFLKENDNGIIIADTSQLFVPGLRGLTSAQGQRKIAQVLEHLCVSTPSSDEIPLPGYFIRRFSDICIASKMYKEQMEHVLPS